MYPIKFNNILKYRLWGGESIVNKLQRVNNTSYNLIGESWDISDREEDQSIVTNGDLKGLSLKELREKHGKTIFGNNFDVSKPFPILVKVLDAKKDLSLQVHPRKKDLVKLDPTARSKSEFWYILDHEENAKIMAGLKKDSTVDVNKFKNDFIENLSSYNLLNFINITNSKNDRLIYVESGTIHAIGAGNLILEIQENSDTTYRVSDWGRLDENGNPRDLHIKESLTCIDFNENQQPIITDVNTKETNKVVNSEYFETYNYGVNTEISYTTSSKTCSLLSVTNGEVTVSSNLNVTAKKGDTILLPANLTYKITNTNNNLASILITNPKY